MGALRRTLLRISHSGRGTWHEGVCDFYAFYVCTMSEGFTGFVVFKGFQGSWSRRFQKVLWSWVLSLFLFSLGPLGAIQQRVVTRVTKVMSIW